MLIIHKAKQVNTVTLSVGCDKLDKCMPCLHYQAFLCMENNTLYAKYIHIADENIFVYY